MKHKILELATIEDVPEILEIQHQAFAPQCKALGWNDCLPLNETLDSAYEDFGNYKTFKIQNDDGKIIGSVRGHVTDGSLLIGHLVVHPDYQGQGLGKFLLREIQKCLPHNRAWLTTCVQIQRNYNLYRKEGFTTFKTEEIGHGLTRVFMEK